MVRKKTEGDEDQRRAAALEAQRAGEAPSAEHSTTGASKQRTHVPHGGSHTHEEKVSHIHEGKQGSRRAREPQGNRSTESPYQGRGHPPYTEAHEQVFRALADAQRSHGGKAVHLQEIARTTHRSAEETRNLMHDLTAVHGLATELQGSDTPDLGPRYETKPGR